MENIEKVALHNMLKSQKSEDILKASFLIFRICKENFISRIAIIIICFVPAALISMQKTVALMQNISGIILNTALALFGIIFTGYALFQALLGGRLVKILLTNTDDGLKNKNFKSTLQKSNESFVELMMQFLISIIASLFLSIILHCISENFVLFNSMTLNIIICTISITLYFYHFSAILWRMISFVFNIYQIFNAYAVSTFLEYSQNEK